MKKIEVINLNGSRKTYTAERGELNVERDGSILTIWDSITGKVAEVNGWQSWEYVE